MTDFTAPRDQIIAMSGGSVHVHGLDAEALDTRLAQQTAALLAAFHASAGETAARTAGLTDERILALARRIVADVPDLDGAFAELDRAVTVAIEVQTRGILGSNTGHFVDEDLARMAALSAESRDAEAAAEADRAFADWQHRQRLETQKGIALLDAGLRADILNRDPASAARRIALKLELEVPDPTHRFAALRAAQDDWYKRGDRQIVNLDLDVSIILGRRAVASASNADERAAALITLGNAQSVLGRRERDAAKLEAAVSSYRTALEERTLLPSDRAATTNRLGTALELLGALTDDMEILAEAVKTHRAALQLLGRASQPLVWAKYQKDLGTSLRSLGRREDSTTSLFSAIDAFQRSLEAISTLGSRRDWIDAHQGLAATLKELGNRENDAEKLREAVAAYQPLTSEQVRGWDKYGWAMAQYELGQTLEALGSQKPDTESLRRAVAAYQASQEVWSRDWLPSMWAHAQGMVAGVLATIADRTGQPRASALAAIDAALDVLRVEGAHRDTRTAELLETAEAIRRRIVGN